MTRASPSPTLTCYSRIPLVVTYRPQCQHLRDIMSAPQSLLENDRPWGQPASPLVSNSIFPGCLTPLQGIRPCCVPRWQLCPLINADLITQPKNTDCNIRGLFTCTPANVMYAITSLQCHAAVCHGHTGYSWHVKMNKHQSHIDTRKAARLVAEHFNLPG